MAYKESHELAALSFGGRLLVAEVLGKDVADTFHSAFRRALCSHRSR